MQVIKTKHRCKCTPQLLYNIFTTAQCSLGSILLHQSSSTLWLIFWVNAKLTHYSLLTHTHTYTLVRSP